MSTTRNAFRSDPDYAPRRTQTGKDTRKARATTQTRRMLRTLKYAPTEPAQSTPSAYDSER